MSNIVAFPVAQAAAFKGVARDRDVVLARGAALFRQGERVRGVWELAEGLIALERDVGDGTRTMLKIVRPGALFPCADLFAGETHAAGARALTRARLRFVAADRLLDEADADADLRRRLTRLGFQEARENEDIIFALHHADLGERVLGVLRTLASELGRPTCHGGTVMTLPMNWRDLARMVGSSPDVISRLLRRLSKAGRLTFSRRTVTLPDFPIPPGELSARPLGRPKVGPVGRAVNCGEMRAPPN